MEIKIRRDRSGTMRHVVNVGSHTFPIDLAVESGGEDSGVDPHDLYDSAVGGCKALTVLWYANRKGIPVEDITVTVTRDGSGERSGLYRLRTVLEVTGDLTEEQRQELLKVAGKCPVHKLMTQVTTEIETELVAAD